MSTSPNIVLRLITKDANTTFRFVITPQTTNLGEYVAATLASIASDVESAEILRSLNEQPYDANIANQNLKFVRGQSNAALAGDVWRKLSANPNGLMAYLDKALELNGFGNDFKHGMGLNYSNEVDLPNGTQICEVTALTNSGWLYQNKDRTFFSLHASLEDCVNRCNPIKEWDYDSKFETFEEDVIEAWLETGVDVQEKESKPVVLEVYEPFNGIKYLLPKGVNKANTDLGFLAQAIIPSDNNPISIPLAQNYAAQWNLVIANKTPNLCNEQKHFANNVLPIEGSNNAGATAANDFLMTLWAESIERREGVQPASTASTAAYLRHHGFEVGPANLEQGIFDAVKYMVERLDEYDARHDAATSTPKG